MHARYPFNRPHRIRLLKEIERRKKPRVSANTGGREKRRTTMTGKLATTEMTTNSPVHQEFCPSGKLETPERVAPAAPAQNKKLENASHPTEENDKNSGLGSEIGQTDEVAELEVAELSSTSTACTPYEKVASSAEKLAPLAQDCVATPREGGDSLHSSPAEESDREVKVPKPPEYNEMGSSAHLRREGHPLPGREAASTELKSQTHVVSTGDNVSAPFIRKSNASVGRNAATPSLKGTLQMSGVRAGNMKIAFGGDDPFLQVKTCDQLRRTNAVAGKGDYTAKYFRGKVPCA